MHACSISSLLWLLTETRSQVWWSMDICGCHELYLLCREYSHKQTRCIYLVLIYHLHVDQIIGVDTWVEPTIQTNTALHHKRSTTRQQHKQYCNLYVLQHNFYIFVVHDRQYCVHRRVISKYLLNGLKSLMDVWNCDKIRRLPLEYVFYMKSFKLINEWDTISWNGHKAIWHFQWIFKICIWFLVISLDNNPIQPYYQGVFYSLLLRTAISDQWTSA